MTEDLLNSIVYQKMGKVDAAIDSTIEEIKRDLLKAESVKQVDAVLKNYATKLPEASLNAMREAGSYYTEIVNQVKSTYQGLGYVLPPIDYSIDTLQAVNTLNSLQYDYLGGRSRLVGGAARQTILDTVLGDQPKRKTARALERILQKKVGERARGYSQTIIRSSASVTGQGVANRVAEAVGVEYWEYEGRIDKNTRPFCYAILKGKDPNSNGPIPYSQESSNFKAWYAGLKKLPMHKGSDGKFYIHISVIRKMDNKQMPNVEVTRGGYNCTHEWLAAPVMVNAELIEKNPKLHEAYMSGQGQAQKGGQTQSPQQQQTPTALPEFVDFSGIPTNAKAILKEYTDIIRPEAKALIQNNRKPSKITATTKKGAAGRYNFETKELIFRKTSQKNFLHEYGHSLDNSIRKIQRRGVLEFQPNASELPQFKAAFEKDREKYWAGKEFVNGIFKKWGYDPQSREQRENTPLVDVLDAFYGGRVFSEMGFWGGHGTTYYHAEPEKQYAETFANMFVMWAGKVDWTKAKEFFPNVTTAFENIVLEAQNGEID